MSNQPQGSLRELRYGTGKWLNRPLGAAVAAGAAIMLAMPVSAAPKVVADIAPIHSLVSQVMDGVDEPGLIIRRGASPHHYSLRPSEAAALEEAEVVFWAGESLAPNFERALRNLAGDAVSVELLTAEGAVQHEYRDHMDSHDHGNGHDDHGHDDHGHDDHGHGHDDHGHDDHGHGHDDHGHDDHGHGHDDHGHDDHGHGHDDHGHDDHDHGHSHDHAHEGTDPHAWLDPVNARVWLSVIADTLAEVDPANADAYQANADAGQERMTALIADIEALVEPVQGETFVVFHDAYQYFEYRFGVEAVGSISVTDASDPSASRIARVQERVRDFGVSCVFSEPQFNPAMVETVMEGTDARTAVLDPLGTEIPEGPDFYSQLMMQMAESLAGCLAGDA